MPKDTKRRIIDGRRGNRATTISGVTITAPAPSVGVTDHGALTGLADDDHAQYLRTDGTRALSGNLAVGSGITIDGIDISAHAADPAAHHAPVTAGDGIGIAGQLASVRRNANSGLAIAIDGGLALGTPMTASVASANGLTGNQHSHAVASSSNPGATASILASSAAGWLTLVALATTDRLRSPLIDTASGDLSIAPATGITTLARLYASNRLRTPLLDTASGDLSIAPAGALVRIGAGKGVQANDYASGWSGYGWRIDESITTAGRSSAEFDDLTVRGQMRVYELLIQQIRATNGSVFVSSTGKADGVTANGGASYTITTATDHGFLVGDLIRAQRFTGAGTYQCDMTVTAVGSTTVFTATLRTGSTAPAAGMEFVRLGSTSNAARRGSLYLTADDAGAPYMDVVNGIAAFGDWNTAGKIKVRLGRLDGITGGSQEYGLIAGQNGFALADSWLKIGSGGAEIHNIPLRSYNGAALASEMTAYGRLRLGVNLDAGSTTFFDADPISGTLQIGHPAAPSAVTVFGAINVTGGNAATLDNVTGAANLVLNSSFELDTNGDGLADGFDIYNNDGAAVPTTASRVAGSKSTWAQRISWTGTNASTKGIYFQIPGGKRANQPYVLTFWARTGTPANITRHWNVAPSVDAPLIWPQANTTWQFYAVRMQWASANTDPFYLSIQNGSPIANGWIEFDNVQVVEGDSIVPWAPAPADKADTSLSNSVLGTLIQGANIRVGTGVKDGNLNGWNIDAGEIVGQAAGVDQVVLGQDGRIQAGAGAVSIGVDGIRNEIGTAYGNNAAYNFASAGAVVGGAWAQNNAAGSLDVLIGANLNNPNQIGNYAIANRTSGVTIRSAIHASTGYASNIVLEARNAWNSSRVAMEIQNSSSTGAMINFSHTPTVGAALAQIWHTGNDDVLAKTTGAIFTGQVTRDVTTSSYQNGLMVRTSGALATATGNDYLTIYHLQDNEMAIGVADSSAWRTLVLQPSGGIVESRGYLLSSRVGYDTAALSLASGWSNYGSGWQEAGYSRFGDMIIVSGLVSPTTSKAAGATMATLPAGYRPSGHRRWLTTTAAGATYLDVYSTGVISCGGALAAGQWVSIECIFKIY